MPKQITLTLADEEQVILAEIQRLQAEYLKNVHGGERRIIASAVGTGLRKDLATLRRFASLAARLSQ